LNLSSLAITPTNLYRKRLSRFRKDSAIKITTMPVFSNVGEPSCGTPWTRSATAVVFGLAGVQGRVFGIYRSQTKRIISALGIEKHHLARLSSAVHGYWFHYKFSYSSRTAIATSWTVCGNQLHLASKCHVRQRDNRQEGLGAGYLQSSN
jgi:hypothetical protein